LDAPLEAFAERCREGITRIDELIEELREEGKPTLAALMVVIHAIREESATWSNGAGDNRSDWRPTT
jgi:hypothetical protein